MVILMKDILGDANAKSEVGGWPQRVPMWTGRWIDTNRIIFFVFGEFCGIYRLDLDLLLSRNVSHCNLEHCSFVRL
jgi:hypothetical protein